LKIQELNADGQLRGNIVDVTPEQYEKIKRLEGDRLRWIPVEMTVISPPKVVKRTKKTCPND
jgi:hypothetical protein